MTRTSRRTRLATAAVIAPLALGLVACGGDDDADARTAISSDTSSETSDGGAAGLEGDVETAAETALAEVDGTVLSVDGDTQGWDVTIVTVEGVEKDVELDPAGTAVTRGPEQDKDTDRDDAAETERLLDVSVDYLAVMDAAAIESQGTVTGVDLSEDDGAAVWQVSFDEDTPGETAVAVDAETSNVLGTERDDWSRLGTLLPH